tara:strand:- start:5486 stop:7675 length:2190 start_codon:yes stop_codon:yes gene_type:complete
MMDLQKKVAELQEFEDNSALFEISKDLIAAEGNFDSCTYEGSLDYGAIPITLRIEGVDRESLDKEGILQVAITDYVDIEDIVDTDQSKIAQFFQHATNYVRRAILEPQFANDILDDYPAASDLANLIQERYHDSSNPIYGIHIIVITNRLFQGDFDLELQPVEGIPVRGQVIDLHQLEQLENYGQSDLIINLEDDKFGEKIPVLTAVAGDSDSNTYESYVGVISGDLLFKIYQEHQLKLLESNVRVFLQFKGDANKGMLNTIQDRPNMFFAYNNGITATVEDVVIEDGHIVKLTNFQIVNGAQTTGSIYTAKMNADQEGQELDLSPIKVQIKLTKVDRIKAPELVSEISQYSNTQNKLNASDFSANHPYHLVMEQLSRTVGKEIPVTKDDKDKNKVKIVKHFYERSNGQYEYAKNDPEIGTDFRIEYPPANKVNKQDLARYIETFEGRPYQVMRGAQNNFRDFAKRIADHWGDPGKPGFSNVIVDANNDHTGINSHYYKECIAKRIIYKAVDKEIAKQEWYKENSIGRNIKAALVVYSIAKFVEELKNKELVINFNKIWEDQSLDVASPVILEILGIAEVLADPDSDPIFITSTEKAKTQTYWNLVKAQSLLIDQQSLKDYVVTVTDEKNLLLKEQTRQLERYRENIHRVVNSLPVNFWAKSRLWAINNIPDYDSSYLDLLESAANMTGSNLPPEACYDIYSIYKELNNLGTPFRTPRLEELTLQSKVE